MQPSPNHPSRLIKKQVLEHMTYFGDLSGPTLQTRKALAFSTCDILSLNYPLNMAE